MRVQIFYDNLNSSTWTDDFIENRVKKLEKYLNPSALIHVNLKWDKKVYSTKVVIHHSHTDYAFGAEGENLFESFTMALEKAMRTLRDEKHKLKLKVNRRYSDLSHELSE